MKRPKVCDDWWWPEPSLHSGTASIQTTVKPSKKALRKMLKAKRQRPLGFTPRMRFKGSR